MGKVSNFRNNTGDTTVPWAAVGENYHSLVKLPLNVTAKEIAVQWLATNGAETVRLFSADLME